MASKREYVSLCAVAGVLIAALWLVRYNDASIKSFITLPPAHGIFLYFLLNLVDAIVAPGATLPLIPVAARAWGRLPAALVTTAGWVTGSLLAFLVARHWGT